MKEKETKEIQKIIKSLKRSYQFANKNKKYLFFFLISSIIYSALSIALPILYARQILYLTSEIWVQLVLITIGILLLEVMRNLNRYLNNYFVDKFFFAVSKNITLEVAKETLKINTKTMNQNSSGLFIERITNDTDVLADIFVSIIDYSTEFISCLGIYISMFFLDIKIFLLYGVFLITIYISNRYASKKLQEKRKMSKKTREKISGFITELVRGSKDIKILNSEKSFLKKTDSLTEEYNQTNYTFDRTSAKYRLINESIRDILDFLIILIGIYSIMKGNLVVGTLLIVLSYRENILEMNQSIERFLDCIKRYSLSAERIFDIIDGTTFPKEKFGTKHLEKMDGNIEFQNVSFSYLEDQSVLEDVSFKIQPNETVSFVGKSGAGKSTIFNLISGLYFPTKGTIKMDQIDMTLLDKDSIRGNVSVISQSPYIFNMSIKDNFKIIKEDVTDEEIVDACKLACLHDFILTLKDGYNTIVGEGGVTLSGGERQRLAIARALVQKTEVILFDEATSALDNETERQIQESILNLQGKYTVLIIAHRLSTVIHSNRIILIDHGKVIDIGTHEELLKRSPLYQNLYELELKNKKEI